VVSIEPLMPAFGLVVPEVGIPSGRDLGRNKTGVVEELTGIEVQRSRHGGLRTGLGPNAGRG
jgi:hypothetical protein